MIVVLATIEVRPDSVREFLAEFQANVPLVLQEQGCLEYTPMQDLATSIAAQIPERPHVVTVVEKWETLDDLEAHLIAPHMLEYRKRVKDYVSGVELQVLAPAGAQDELEGDLSA